MIIDKYTKHSIFSLPILFYNRITAKELKDNQFVNMYVYDRNKPILDCIFLVFRKLNSELLYKLSNLEGYYNHYMYNIDNVDYHVVSFTKDYYDSYIVESINKGMYYTLGFDEKMKVIKFWLNPKMNEKIFRYLFDEKYKVEKPIKEGIEKLEKNKAVDFSTAFLFCISTYFRTWILNCHNTYVSQQNLYSHIKLLLE